MENVEDSGRIEAASTRTVFLVAGMHRSGTSSLAGTLTCLGVTPPRNLIGPSENNAKGYWESPVIRDLNDEILTAAGLSWDDVQAIPPDWFGEDRAMELADRVKRVFDAEFGATGRVVVKDPRLCRLLPLWRSALATGGVELKVLIPFRNPLEVASSLEQRSELPKTYGLILWLQHVLSAERDSRGLTRSFVAFDSLLGDWRQELARLGSELHVEWPRLDGPVEARIDDFLSPRLRHHATHELPTRSIPVPVRRCYETLLSQCVERPYGPWESIFDELREELDAAADLLGPSIAAMRQRAKSVRSGAASAAELIQLRTSTRLLEQETARLREEAARLRSADEEQRRQLDRFRRAKYDLEEREAALEAENAWLNEGLRSRFAELLDLEKRLEKTQRKLEAAKRALAEGAAHPQHRRMVDVDLIGTRIRKLARDPKRFLEDSRYPLLSRIGKRF